MNTVQRLMISLSLIVLFVFTGCKNEKDNIITIEFEEPTAGQVLPKGTPVDIHIHFTATDEIHDVEVILHPDGDTNNKIINFDEHVHEAEYVFEQTVDLSTFATGTKFHLEVVVTKDHDGTETQSDDIEFSIN